VVVNVQTISQIGAVLLAVAFALTWWLEVRRETDPPTTTGGGSRTRTLVHKVTRPVTTHLVGALVITLTMAGIAIFIRMQEMSH